MTIKMRILLTLIPSAVFATALSGALMAKLANGTFEIAGTAILSAVMIGLIGSLLQRWWLRPLQELATAARTETDDPVLRPLAERLDGQATPGWTGTLHR